MELLETGRYKWNGIKIGIISDGVEDISEADRSGALPESACPFSGKRN